MKWKILIGVSLFLAVSSYPATDAVCQNRDQKHIRVKKLHQYDVTGGVVGAQSRIVTEERYTESGQLDEFIEYDTEGTVQNRKTNAYDADDRIIESTIVSPKSDYSMKIAFSYENNLLTQAVSTYSYIATPVIMEYIYNDKGKVTESVSRTPDNTQYQRMLYTYNTDGKPGKVTAYNLDGSIAGEELFEYDQSGLIARKFGKNQKLTQKIDKKLDSKGNLIQEVQYDAEGRVVKRTSNTFNDKGWLVETISEMPHAGIKTRISNQYDENGQVIEQISFNKFDVPVTVIRVTYEYYE